MFLRNVGRNGVNPHNTCNIQTRICFDVHCEHPSVLYGGPK